MRAALAALFLVATPAGLIGVAAAAPPTPAASPAVSAFLAHPLQEARAAREAGSLDREIAALLKAQATRGRKTEFDQYLINSWLAIAYVNKRDFAKAEPLLMAAAQSPYASPAGRKGFMEAAVAILTTPPPK